MLTIERARRTSELLADAHRAKPVETIPGLLVSEAHEAPAFELVPTERDGLALLMGRGGKSKPNTDRRNHERNHDN